MGFKDTARAIKAFVRGRPAFIEVCTGPLLSAAVTLDDDTAIFPLAPLGNGQNVTYGAEFIRALGVPTDLPFQERAMKEGRSFHGATVLVHCGLNDQELALASAGDSRHVQRTRALISFFVAGEIVPFLRFLWTTPKRGEANFLPPRGRAGVPLRAADDPINAEFLQLVHTGVDADDQFHFYLSMLEQSHGMTDDTFRIARMFSLLEAMASAITRTLKRGDSQVGTRTGVRVMLGYYTDYDIPLFTVGERSEFEFDHIELAGQLRDRLFHGAGLLKESEVRDVLKPGVRLLSAAPDLIAHWLRRDCEMELMRYAKRIGRSWRGQQGEQFPLPEQATLAARASMIKPLISSRTRGGQIKSIFVQVRGEEAGVVRLRLMSEQ